MNFIARRFVYYLGIFILTAGISTPSVLAAPSWWPFGSTNVPEASSAAPASTKVPEIPSIAPAATGQPVFTSFAPIVKKVAPSVVTVFTTKKIREDMRALPFMNDPFFQRFFGNGAGGGGDADDPSSQTQRKPHYREQRGLGSGVIVSPDGIILTNVHVVDATDEIKVAIGDEKKEYDAKVIGKDALTDVAVIKIDAHDLPAMPLADSSQVQVGDVVLAIGNPFALGQTVTMGIVSALARNLPPSEEGNDSLNDFIQTDAAINPGNSGGPLVDMNGRMIGVNSAIYTRNGGNMGIGFAIPSNMAHSVMASILKQGRVIRGFLGVGANELTPELVKKFNLPDANGVVVSEIETNSAAEAAGVKAGDVIITFNGHKILDYHSLRSAVTETTPGDKVKMVVIREGKEKTLDVVLKEMPANAQANAQETPTPDATPAPSTLKLLPGVEIDDLNADTRRLFGAMQYPADLKGAVVVSVDPDSPAAVPGAAGLESGDVLLEVEHKEIHSAKEAVAAAKNAKGGLLLRVWTRGNPRYMVIKTSE